MRPPARGAGAAERPLVGLLLAATFAVAAGARFVIDDDGMQACDARRVQASQGFAGAPAKTPRALPAEVRGIHVTMALASLDGKLEEYLELIDEGLNTIELDVKDENGEIGFVPSAVPLAKKVGAAKPYYRPRQVARLMHARGIYLIGRVVMFEDPLLSAGAPELAIRTKDGSRWLNARRPRLDEPVRPARLGLQRRDRGGRRPRRLRRDPVRLRPLPVRRRHRRHRLPGQDLDAAGLGDHRIRAVRGEAPAAARRAGLDRPVRPRRDAQPRRRSDSEANREVRRRDLPDGLPVALRPRRVRARGSERRSRARRSSGRSPTSGAS